MALYVLFGVCTTVVSVVVYWLAAHVLGTGVMAGTVLAWVAAVLFAYLTNRRWVFHSGARGAAALAREAAAFYGRRLATGAVDWAMMYVLAERMGFDDVAVKAASNAVVIAPDYVASKLVVFRRGSEERQALASGYVWTTCALVLSLP